MAQVLVVDDDPVGRELLHTLLSYGGHETREASDGAQALELALNSRPDLIVADVLMPTMDGFEFVRRLREYPQFAATPVIFYSASYLEAEARHLAQRCGVIDILVKPCEPQRLMEIINRALQMPHAPVLAPSAEEFHHEHVNLLTSKVLQSSGDAVGRLKALIELGLEHASEHDPQRLLSGFCSAARKIIGARYAVVAVVEGVERTLHFRHAAGVDPVIAGSLAEVQLSATPERLAARRLEGLSGDPLQVGLPPAHPPVHGLLAEPVTSLGQVQACLYLTNKLGASGFSDDDQALARILAAQLGRIYANAHLYAQVKHQMGNLETEIYERKRAQEEVQQLNAELEQRITIRTAALKEANEELEAFAQTVAHDLKAPLRAINGFSNLLMGQFGSALPSEGQRFLQIVCTNARSMNRLIEDLLSFSRFSRQALSAHQVDMNSIARSAADEVSAEHGDRQINMHIGNLPAASGDPGLLKQVWSNLISNAFKYTGERVHTVIEISGKERPTEIIYCVRDNGIGFPMHEAPALFAAFRRLHSDPKFEGEGVGLSICKRIIQRHGGTVWAEGDVGHGAAFYFTLPRTPVSSTAEGT